LIDFGMACGLRCLTTGVSNARHAVPMSSSALARPVSAWAAPAQPIARLPCRLAGDEAG
jgi:hypothetical protein